MVYLMENTGTLQPEAVLHLVSPARQEKALACRSLEAQRNALAVFLLLRYGLLQEYGITKLPQLTAAKGGKPALQWPHLHFNFSHSGSAAVCALSIAPVGVDIQVRSVCRPSVLRHAFSPAEQQSIAAAKNPGEAFTAIWSRKEAYGKAMGLGLRYPLAEADLSRPCTLDEFLITTRPWSGGFLSLCAKEDLPVHPVSLQQLLEALK